MFTQKHFSFIPYLNATGTIKIEAVDRGELVCHIAQLQKVELASRDTPMELSGLSTALKGRSVRKQCSRAWALKILIATSDDPELAGTKKYTLLKLTVDIEKLLTRYL